MVIQEEEKKQSNDNDMNNFVIHDRKPRMSSQNVMKVLEVNKPKIAPKLVKVILCFRCELKDNGGRNESVV